MSDIIKDPGMELHDAALEGVSGGTSVDDIELIFCSRCAAKRSPGLCTGGVEQLTEYISRHGLTDCPNWRHCPFLSLGH